MNEEQRKQKVWLLAEVQYFLEILVVEMVVNNLIWVRFGQDQVGSDYFHNSNDFILTPYTFQYI